MMKEIKNPRAMTIEFRPEVANALRDLCSKTGITLTRAVNNAVESYMPTIQKMIESMHGITFEKPEEISTDVDINELCDTLFKEYFEITHDDNDFVQACELKHIIMKAITENEMYRNAGIKYGTWFIDFLWRRYGLKATRPYQVGVRKRGYVGIRPIHHTSPIHYEEVF